MEIQIRKLEPSLLEDYLYFCEHTAHTDYPEFARCYCVSYYGRYSVTEADAAADFTLPDVRRKYAIQFVTNGNLQGYLAYDGSRVVGWCNANDRADCLECWGFQEYKAHIELDVKTKSVFCFVIAPDMRGKGIATALLERVCADAKNEGYACVEGYPEKADNMYDHFHGPLGLYEKLGFCVAQDMGKKAIVRKTLK